MQEGRKEGRKGREAAVGLPWVSGGTRARLRVPLSASGLQLLQLVSPSSASVPRIPMSAPDDCYRSKCKHLERKIKEMIFLNAALEGELRECRDSVAASRADRKLLLNRLLAFQRTENGHLEPPAATAAGVPLAIPTSNGATSAKKAGGKSRTTVARSEASNSKRRKADADSSSSSKP